MYIAYFIMALFLLILCTLTILLRRYETTLQIIDIKIRIKKLSKEEPRILFLDNQYVDLIHDSFFAFKKRKGIDKIDQRTKELESYYSTCVKLYQSIKGSKARMKQVRNKMMLRYDSASVIAAKAGLKFLSTEEFTGLINMWEKSLDDLLLKCSEDPDYNYTEMVKEEFESRLICDEIDKRLYEVEIAKH